MDNEYDFLQRFEKFQSDFAKLKANREKIPMEQLTTKYAKAYSKLVADIEEFAEYFTEYYIRGLAIPEYPADQAGNEWLGKKTTTIVQQEKMPGGLYQQARNALIDSLDEQKFYDLVSQLHCRLEREAYDPYQQRFNRWVGEPGNRWIYNRLFDAFWFSDPSFDEGGYWGDKSRRFKRSGYPPTKAKES